MRVRLAAAALAVVIAASAPARAAGASAADRDAARALAGKGYEAFEEGQFQRAVELFQQAEGRYHAPPHWLYIARAQRKLGRIVDAEASLQRVVDEKLAPDAPAPFKEAQAAARAELPAIKALVPSLSITLDGDLPEGARVLVDGEPVAPADLARPLRRDPGSHLIAIEPPGKPAIERTVVLTPGGDARVVLPLPRRSAPYAVPGAILVGLGAAGLVAGVATAAIAVDAKDPGALRIAEISAFAVGGAALLTGVVLVAIRPKANTVAAATALRVGIGPGSISIGGAF